MGYKDKEVKRKASREAMKRKRALQGTTLGTTSEGTTEKKSEIDVKEYPAILEALVDPIRRPKLKRIRDGLKAKGLMDKVFYGVGGLNFEDIDKLLVSTEGVI